MRDTFAAYSANPFPATNLWKRTPKYREVQAIIDEQRVDAALQPIFDLSTGDLVAYEALCRVINPGEIQTPGELFELAEATGLLYDLELLCQQKAVKKYQSLGSSASLCINLSPSILLQEPQVSFEKLFSSEVMNFSFPIVIEITERRNLNGFKRLKEFMTWLKTRGFRIALDDLGSGFAGLKSLLDLEPSIVKVDRHLISKLHLSTKKQLLCNAIVSFCRKVGITVVAEGVETAEELQIVSDIRFDWVQGFYLGQPELEPQGCSGEPRNKILNLMNSYNLYDLSCSGQLLGCLATYVVPVESSTLVKDVEARFQSEENLTAIPVIKDGKPVGLIKKTDLFFRLGQRYGYALYAGKPVSTVMGQVSVFEADTPIEAASRKVTARDEKSIYDAIVVTRNESYVGVVKIHQILEQITARTLLCASQSNPLTGLPGNNLIKDEISRRLEQGMIFAVGYVDLDHFKPFNDRFGFERGDQVIRFLAQILREHVLAWDAKGFVGHIGGDDFVFVVRASDVEQLCERILSDFRSKIGQFHEPQCVERGYYEAVDRQGTPRYFPLLSLSIAVVTNKERVFQSYAHLASVASEVKNVVKRMPGNAYFIDRRNV